MAKPDRPAPTPEKGNFMECFSPSNSARDLGEREPPGRRTAGRDSGEDYARRVFLCHSTMRRILLTLFLLAPLGWEAQSGDQVDPPYGGTVWIDPDIITPSDPTALVSVTDTGRGERTMFDQRVKGLDCGQRLFVHGPI